MGGSLRQQLEAWSGLVARDRFGCPPARVADSVRRTGSVLVPGADPARIAAAEARLGVTLPPSYREFLSISDGAWGGQLGIQYDPPGSTPTALLPADGIGFVSVDDPLLVDGVVQYQTAGPLGQSTLHQPIRGDEVAYLFAPWAEARGRCKRGQAHWSLRIGGTADPATVVLLNPMVMDGDGEWELMILQPEEEFRYPSFVAWLEAMLDRERRTQQPPGRARARVQRATATNPAAISAAQYLIDVEHDTDWLVGRLERVLAPGVRPVFQEMALQLIEWVDIEHGTAHLAVSIRRLLDDPLHLDVPLLAQVAESPVPGLPTPDEVASRRRPADGRRPGDLPTAALAALYDTDPDPVLAGLLERRGHRPLVTPERVHLDALIPAESGYFRAGTAAEVDRHRFLAPPVIDLTEGAIIDLGRRDGLPTTGIARALVRAGHADAAVAHLEQVLEARDEPLLLYTIAEIDTPTAWHALDRAADSKDAATRITSLEAAARTSSPLLAPRAAELLDGTDVENLTALLALELQPTPTAGDALLDAWRSISHLGALRALARRRDPRVVDDCLLLLTDEDPAISRVGAETLRDLRHPPARRPLLAALEAARDDDLIVIVAHALTMLHAVDAAPVMIDQVERVENEALAELLARWATQLLARAAHN